VQAFAVHVRTLHSVSWPGHIEASRQATQFPLPSHTTPPAAQVTPAAVFVCVGAPIEQPSVTQGLGAVGTFVGSKMTLTWPMPLQTFCLQGPAVWVDTGVPACV
jgi:hypothetical protein